MIDRIDDSRVDVADQPAADTDSATELGPDVELEITPADRSQPISISDSQLGIWFFETHARASSAVYQIPTLVKLSGRLDLSALLAAIRNVVARHEILRCGISETGGEVVLRIEPPYEVVMPVEFVDEDDVATRVAALAAVPFVFGEGKLVRWRLFTTGADRHQLLILQHHIVSDGWSVGILVQELLETYVRLAAGEPGRDEVPTLNYADYAAWSHSTERQKSIAAAIRYWVETLSGVPVLELPIDHARPSQLSGRGRHYHFRLPADLVGELRRFARSRRATPYAVLFAAHALLLARYSGQHDFVVAMPVDGRTQPELADMLGCFINVLPMRCRVDRSAGFGPLVDATFDSLLDGATFQEAPFHRIVAALGASEATHDTVMAKLFRSLFVLDSFNRDRRFEAEGLVADIVVEADQAIAKNDIGFGLQEVGDEIAVKIEYSLDLFEPDKIRRMADHFVRLLALGLADPDMPVGRLPLLSQAEFSDLVVVANRTATSFPRERSLADLFDAAVRQFANRPAYIENGRPIDFATLSRRADAFAGVLIRAGLRPQDRVGILLDRGLDSLIAILATIRARGVYVPVDPTYPPDRIDMILDDAEVRIVVVGAGVSDSVGAGRAKLSISHRAAEEAADPVTLPSRPPTDIAYVCYTSGTTGRPRGVAIPDHAVIALVFENNYLDFRADLRIGFASNLVFDAVTLEIWGALLHGGCLVQVPRATLLEVDTLSALLHAEHVDVVILTAALFHRFAEERPAAFGGMEAILTGGAVVNPSAVARVLGSETPPRSVLNCYGPTETTTIVATHRMRPGHAIDEGHPLPIGRAIANAHLYIVDAEGEPVPVGVPGELMIGGAGVAKGYLNQPDLNALKFVDLLLAHPDRPDAPVGDRVYRSGDLARWRDDGLIEFIGRADRQIKLRGFRVELGEIEATILSHPDISDAIVVPRAIGSDLRLDAYYSGEAAPATTELRALLASRLPGYMLPNRLVRLAAMPVNVAGKIDAAMLPEALEPVETERPVVAALSPAALQLREIVGEVLACPLPGLDDDFFALGGDSIQSIRVAGRARDRGLPLTVRDIFEHRTVARLVAMLEARAPVAGTPSADGSAEIPLIPIQHAFFDFDLTDRNHFNLALLLKAPGRLDQPRLQRAMNAVVAAHEALRSRWPAAEAGHGPHPRQVILPMHEAGTVQVAVHTLDQATTITSQLDRICTDWQAGFDIERGPIVAAGIVCGHTDGCDRLFLALHHLAVDVVSLWVLVDHLWHAYDTGLPPPLQEAGAAGRWAHSLALQANAAGTARELPHWRDAVAGPRHFEARLPAPMPRFERRRVVSAASFNAAAGVGHALLELRPHEVLTAAAVIAFAAVTEMPDITLAVESHGRAAGAAGEDISRTIGWFTAVYPCRIRLPAVGNDDPLEAFAAAKDALRAVPNDGIGFGLLRYLSADGAASGSLAHWVSADLSVNYIGGFDVSAGDWRLEDDAPGATVGPANQTVHTLDLTAFQANGEFSVVLICDGRRVEHSLADSFADRLVATLERLAVMADAAPARLVTASDHPLSGLSRQTLSRLLGPEGTAGRKVVRLSPAEEGMLFETLRRPESNPYTIQIHWHHIGTLDPTRLKAAFEAIVARHEALRGRYVTLDVPHPVRVIEPHADLGWRVLDWRDLNADAQTAALVRFLDEDRRRAFDLTRVGGFRVAIIRRAEDEWEVFWTIHHIYLDGWSVSVVLTELAELYDKLADDTSFDTDPPPAFDAFLRHLIEVPEGPGSAFWSAQLGTFSKAVDLPFRKPAGRVDVPGPDGASARISVPIPAELAAAVEEFSARHAVTHSTVFQFAWALLLGRCAHTGDVVLGTTVSGRTAPVTGIEHMVGLAISTVPLRLLLDQDASALEMIRRMHATLTAIEEHSHVPLTDLQRLSAVPAGERLFHSLFVFENYPWHRLAGGGSLRFDGLELLDKTEMPLTLLVVLQDQPRFEVASDPTLFDTHGVERLCAHILTVLRGILGAPDTPIGAIEIVAPEERHELLSTWNATARNIDLSRTVLDLIAAQVANDPDALAVDHAGATLTYRELDRASSDLARRIRRRHRDAHGIEMPAETIVALVLDRGLALIVAILGTMRAGGAYLPIDTDDPLGRIDFLVDDARAPFILSDHALAQRRGLREAFGERLIVVDDRADPVVSEPLPMVGPEQLAYVIYTSGSTGRPKGTLIEHRGIVNRLEWVQGEYYALKPEDRVLQKTPYTFDVSVWELFWPLVHGARLVFADPGGHREPAYLHRVIREAAISVVHFVPSMLQIFVEHPGLETLSSVRLVAASGEGLPSRLSARVLAALPHVTMIDLYGPTEATIEVGGHRCSPADEGDAAITPIGRPGWNTELHVLDAAGRLMPVGVTGELHIGGIQVARGYLNQPALTAERFVPNPYGSGRLYRTGDLVRRRYDGIIDYLGRIDFQMKIRGMRVEPGEIETALEACPGIGRACVVALENGAALAAYITGDTPLTNDELQARLAVELPAHMVPARIIRLQALPLTSSGKVDRRRLSHLLADSETDSPTVAAAEPLTATAEIVASIYSQVLKAGGRVDADLSFFALGGHSLTAMRVAMRLAERLGIDVPVRLIFEHPTVRAMGAALDRLAPTARTLAPLARVARDGWHKPSFAQARVLFLDGFAEAPGLYLVPATMRIEGTFDDLAFARAAENLVAAHEILRTRYGFADGAPTMRLADDNAVDLRIIDISAEALAEHLKGEANTGFALDREPPIRFRLFRLTPLERVLVITLHHVVTDGWSLDLLLTDLSRRYKAARCGELSAVPASALTYIDFAAWQHQAMSGAQADELAAYWRKRLADAPTLDLPTDRPRPPVASYRGSTADFTLDQIETEQLRQFCERSGCTLFPVLLAAWAVVLSRYSGQQDLVIGTPIASRPVPETADMIGLFQNTIPLRVRLSDEEPIVTLASRLALQIREDFERQNLPFQLLVEALGVARDPSRTPLFQAMLILAGSDPTRPGLLTEDTTVTVLPLGSDTAKVDLTAAFAEIANGISCTIEYASDLFRPETMERLCGHLATALRTFAADPFARVGDIDILTEAERDDLLGRFNATAHPVDASRTVLDCFDEQVNTRPDAFAAVHGAKCMTYRALDYASGSLARAIRTRYREIYGKDMPAETVVALVLERGLPMIVSILAVMKAGGAYMPIDPEEPPARADHMIEDAGAAIVVSETALAERPAVATCPPERLIWADRSHPDSQEALPAVPPRRLAYLIYTSGSTGRPKATPIEHRSLMNRMSWVQATFPLSPDDRVLQKTPYTFDVSISELVWPLVVGARLVFADAGGHRDPAYLYRLIRQEEITVLHFVPSMLRAFTEHPGLETLTSVRFLALIGEPLPTRLAAKVLEALPKARLANFYGPTEATIDVSVHMASVRDERDGPIVAIGRPGWNTTLHVLDAQDRLVPVGVPGELLIGGVQLARGYLNRPDLTAERFIHNPFGPGRLYRTGDIVRRRGDGVLEYLGRRDFQVKIRGMRLEIGEVEAALQAAPGITEACVVAREIGGEKALIAYVAAPRGSDEAKLAAYLAGVLPPHMHPAHIIAMPGLPLTTSGKVDRGALPDPTTSPPPAAGRVEPVSAVERTLVEIWRDVLQHADFGTSDGFFDVGGTSLAAMRMVSAYAARTGRAVPIVAIFRHPTIRDLALHLESDTRDHDNEAVPGIDPMAAARERASTRHALRASRRT